MGFANEFDISLVADIFQQTFGFDGMSSLEFDQKVRRSSTPYFTIDELTISLFPRVPNRSETINESKGVLVLNFRHFLNI